MKDYLLDGEDFNPRSHKGSDEYFHFCSKMLKISIHAPTRGATKVQIELEDKNIFQSTLPQGERRIGRFCSTGRIGISIHAPTRGATTDRLSMQYRYTTFQSTLPQGERRYLYTPNTEFGDFNPRSHKGSDTKQIKLLTTQSYFNPRSHKGSDTMQHTSVHSAAFQSTLPQGERRFSSATSPQTTYFNPRSHKGSDKLNIAH